MFEADWVCSRACAVKSLIHAVSLPAATEAPVFALEPCDTKLMDQPGAKHRLTQPEQSGEVQL